MKDFILNNKQFLLILILWILVGVFGGALVYVFVLGTLILMRNKGWYKEMFLGFILILILSDSRQIALDFAKDLKNYYMLFLSLVMIVDRNQLPRFNTLYQGFIPFFLVASIAMMFSDNFTVSIQKTVSYFLLLLIVPNYITLIYVRYGASVFKEMMYFYSILFIIGFLLIFVNSELVFLEGRFSGILGNSNGMGIFGSLVFLLFTTFSFFFPNLFTLREKIFFYAIILVSLGLSGSRGGILSLLIFVLFFQVFRFSPWVGTLVFLSLAIGFEVLFANLTKVIVSLGLGEYFRLESIETGSGRLIAWGFAWEKIQDNFYIGKGFGHTEFIFGKNYRLLSSLGHQGNAHNSYLTFWLDTGIVGLFFYLMALLSIFVRSLKRSPLALPILFAVLFSVNIESWLTASLNPFTIILMMILTLLSTQDFADSRLEAQNEEIEKA